MKYSIFRAWSIGVGILIAVFTMWFVLLQTNIFSQSIVVILWTSPLIAAFVSAYLGPSHKILLGTSMAIPSALFAVVLNSADQILGATVDFPGFKGGFILFVLVLISAAIVSIPGSLIAYALTKNDQQLTS
jgi:hypothetical protein